MKWNAPRMPVFCRLGTHPTLLLVLTLLHFVYTPWTENSRPPQWLDILPQPKLTIHYPKMSVDEEALVHRVYNSGITPWQGLNNIEKVIRSNSHKLPGSPYEFWTAHEICSAKDACLPAFVTAIPPFVSASPKNKLMACLVQKSMSTILSAIMCYLDRPEEFVAAGRHLLREHPRLRFCAKSNEYHSEKQMRMHLQISARHLRDWTFLMVTRDPLDRFLSGFIDQCIRQDSRPRQILDRTGNHCFGCGYNMTCFMEEIFKRGLSFARTRRPIVSVVDIHLYPQNWRCDMQQYIDYYKFVRYSNRPQQKLIKELAAILRAKNVSESSISFISSSLRSGRTEHSTVKSAARKFLEHRLRSNPYLMEMIIRLFYYDYIHLNYPMPGYT